MPADCANSQKFDAGWKFLPLKNFFPVQRQRVPKDRRNYKNINKNKRLLSH
jgi:hypothetical protein